MTHPRVVHRDAQTRTQTYVRNPLFSARTMDTIGTGNRRDDVRTSERAKRVCVPFIRDFDFGTDWDVRRVTGN